MAGRKGFNWPIGVLIELLPPWHSNRLSRLVKAPKLHLGDTGLASSLLGLDAGALAKNRPLLGQLLETFVLQELRRQASWHDDAISFHHFRDKDRYEVEIVWERGGQSTAPRPRCRRTCRSRCPWSGHRSLSTRYQLSTLRGRPFPVDGTLAGS